MPIRLDMNAIQRLEFDTAGLTGSYQSMDSSGLQCDVQIFKIINNSDVDVEISYDGTTDHDFLPASGSFILDISANSQGSRSAFSKGTQVHLKGASSGTGSVYVSGYTQRAC